MRNVRGQGDIECFKINSFLFKHAHVFHVVLAITSKFSIVFGDEIHRCLVLPDIRPTYLNNERSVQVQVLKVLRKFLLKTSAVTLMFGRSKATRRRKQKTTTTDATIPTASEYCASKTVATGAWFDCAVCRKHSIVTKPHLQKE